MSPRGRRLLFLPAAAGLLAGLLAAVARLPAFGHYPGPYGFVLNGVGVTERHATNLVTAVNFDYRALDTLGEEFILFTATTGVVLLLRTMRGETESPGRAERKEGASDALRGFALAFITAAIV